MRDYTFHTAKGRVVVKDDELVLPAAHRHSHWPRAEVAAVSVEGLTMVHMETATTYGILSHGQDQHLAVNLTRTDGTTCQLPDVAESALEVASQFNLRGYPVGESGPQAEDLAEAATS